MRLRILFYITYLAFLPVLLSALDPALKGSTVPVVALNCNKLIDSGDFLSIDKALVHLADDPSFNMKPLVHKLRILVFGKLKNLLPFQIASEGECRGNPGYKLLLGKKELKDKAPYLFSPTGYLPLGLQSDGEMPMVIREIKTWPSALILTIDYTLIKKVEALGYGTAAIQARTTLKVHYDRDGNVITAMHVFRSAESERRFKFPLAGPLKGGDISPICIEAANLSIDELIKHLKTQQSAR